VLLVLKLICIYISCEVFVGHLIQISTGIVALILGTTTAPLKLRAYGQLTIV
jgi:hypothetical protein